MDKSEKIVMLIMVVLIGFGFSINLIANALFPPTNERTTPRVILFSFDSANPEYLTEEMMPKLYKIIHLLAT